MILRTWQFRANWQADSKLSANCAGVAMEGISRQGKDYISIVDNNSGKRTRLKGTIFEEKFNGPDWIKAVIAKVDKVDSEKRLIDQKLAAEADAKLQEAIRKTALYNSRTFS